MPRKKRDERLNITINESLKRQFDVICALKGLSMSDGAQQAITDWVKKNATEQLLEAIENIPTDESESPAPEPSTRGKGKGKG